MTLPTGTISMSQVNTELGRTSTQAISFNDTDVRRVAGKTSGSISMNDLRGKSNGPVFDYAPGSYNQTDTDVVIFKITSNLAVVWTYTKSGTGANAPTTSGSTSTSFQMQVVAPSPSSSRATQWNLTATYNGVSYNWTCYLTAVGNQIA